MGDRSILGPADVDDPTFATIVARALAEDPTGVLLNAVRDMLEALDIVRVDSSRCELDDDSPAPVWWFAPLIGRWERDPEPPTAKKRTQRRAAGSETLELTAEGHDLDTDIP